jgi:hypothetical protein
VHPKTSVRRKMQDSQCQMTYDDETEVAWALICFLALASGLGVVALTCGRLDQAPTDGVVLV